MDTKEAFILKTREKIKLTVMLDLDLVQCVQWQQYCSIVQYCLAGACLG